jgi:subtilisin family serine protease
MTRDEIARQLVIMVSNREPHRVLERILKILSHLSPELITGWSLTSEEGGEDLVRLYQFPVPPSQDLIEKLNEEPGVLVEHNMTMSQAAQPNDPLYAEQWALTRMSAEAAWDCVVNGGPTAPITVAVVDSGIARSHPDLSARVDPLSKGFVGTLLDAEDEDGHGTFLAGTIGAITDNATGIASVTRPITVKLLALKFYNLSNPLNAAYAAMAIAYAVTNGAKVINLSWHLGMNNNTLRQHINHPSAKDVLFVAAAGNEGTNNDDLPVWPASYVLPNLISVMATKQIPVKAIDPFDDKPGFSNYGPNTVHIAAPGVGVVSTHYGFNTLPPRWRNYTGTSVAAAHVTAAGALIRALRPAWSPKKVRDRLVATVDQSRYLQCSSKGRLNLERAVCHLPP